MSRSTFRPYSFETPVVDLNGFSGHSGQSARFVLELSAPQTVSKRTVPPAAVIDLIGAP